MITVLSSEQLGTPDMLSFTVDARALVTQGDCAVAASLCRTGMSGMLGFALMTTVYARYVHDDRQRLSLLRENMFM